MKISSGEYALKPNKETEYSFFLVESGSFTVERILGENKYVLNHSLNENEFFGEFKYLLKDSFESIRANVDSYVHCFQTEKLNKILKSDPNLANRWFLLLCTIIARRYKIVNNISLIEKSETEESTEGTNLRSSSSMVISRSSLILENFGSITERKRSVSTSVNKKEDEKDAKMCSIFNIPFNVIVKEFECVYKKTSSSKVRGNLYLFRQYVCFYSKILGRKTVIILPFVTIETLPIINNQSFMVIQKSQQKYTFEITNSHDPENIKLIKSYFDKTAFSKNYTQQNLAQKEEDNTFKMSESDWEIIISCAKSIKLKQNEKIIKQGDHYQRLYWIIRGECRVELLDEQTQKTKLLTKMVKEDVFGDLSFLFGGAAAASVLVDSEEVELYCWEKKILEQTFVEKPYLSPKFYLDISKRISKRWTTFLDSNLFEKN